MMKFTLLFLLLIDFVLVISKHIKDAGDTLQVYGHDYDKMKQNMNVILIAVATNMKVNEYSNLANKISNTAHRALVCIIDIKPDNSDPDFPGIQYGWKFLYVQDVIRDLGYDVKYWYVGGHARSGQYCADAILDEELEVETEGTVMGFIGLDPYKLKPRMEINIPSLFWSFTDKSCGISPHKAGVGYFNRTLQYASSKYYPLHKKHYLYVLRRGYTHCVFADHGCESCMNINEIEADKAREEVARSIKQFMLNGSRLNDTEEFNVYEKDACMEEL